QLDPDFRRVHAEAFLRRQAGVIAFEALLQQLLYVHFHGCLCASSGYLGVIRTWSRCMPLCWSTFTLFSCLPRALAVSATERPAAKRRMMTSRCASGNSSTALRRSSRASWRSAFSAGSLLP